MLCVLCVCVFCVVVLNWLCLHVCLCCVFDVVCLVVLFLLGARGRLFVFVVVVLLCGFVLYYYKVCGVCVFVLCSIV